MSTHDTRKNSIPCLSFLLNPFLNSHEAMGFIQQSTAASKRDEQVSISLPTQFTRSARYWLMRRTAPARGRSRRNKSLTQWWLYPFFLTTDWSRASCPFRSKQNTAGRQCLVEAAELLLCLHVHNVRKQRIESPSSVAVLDVAPPWTKKPSLELKKMTYRNYQQYSSRGTIMASSSSLCLM